MKRKIININSVKSILSFVCVLSEVLFVENKYYVQTIGCSGRNILTFISSMERNKDI